MDTVKQFQDQIIDHTLKLRDSLPLSKPVIDAFYKVPREGFVQRFFRADLYKWVQLSPQSREEHLAYIYKDAPLIIHRVDGLILSTMSQPSFVLTMLELLDLKPGQRVFELGTGSGWSAALMAELVGPSGVIDTYEIVPELFDNARKRLKHWPQVHPFQGDGESQCLGAEIYDRVVFTAGSYEFPQSLFVSVKEGGRVLFVLRDEEGPDILFLFQKEKDHFHALHSVLCSFVAMQGHDEHPADRFLDELHGGRLRLGDYELDVYHAAAVVPSKEGQIISQRSESQFVWTRIETARRRKETARFYKI